MKESIGFAKVFDIRVSMDIHVLRCPKHGLIIFRFLNVEYLSMGLHACLQIFVVTISQELMTGN